MWQGGMSFHGGFLGVLVALWFFARRRHKALARRHRFRRAAVPARARARAGSATSSTASSSAAPTDVPWAMVFPQVDNVPRHPSQLYEFGLEGLLLFVVLWIVLVAAAAEGAVSGLFLLGYGTFRFIAEFAREPDSFLGFLARRPHDGPVAVAADDRSRAS